jgi:hypothetical protein
MKIIGCDFNPGYQQIAVLDLATGETEEKALSHERKEEVRAFYGTGHCAGVHADHGAGRAGYSKLPQHTLEVQEEDWRLPLFIVREIKESLLDVTECLVHLHREELEIGVAMASIEAMAAKVHIHFGTRR